MHNNLPAYFSTMKSTLPTVCSRYEFRAPVFHLPYIRHTFAEHSVRLCLTNLLKIYSSIPLKKNCILSENVTFH